MIKIEPIFSVPLIQVNWKDSKNHNKKISDWCLQYEKDNPPTSEKINRFPGSYNYYSDMFVKDENRLDMINQPEFKEFSHFLIQTLKEVNDTIFGQHLKHMQMMRCNISNSWFSINRKGSWHRAHTHGSSIWSVVYYPKSSESGGEIIFTNSLGSYQEHWPYFTRAKSNNEQYLTKEIIINPKEGDLIMFPGYLVHSVDTYNGDEDRICLSFNINGE